jgi:hypothetical protein
MLQARINDSTTGMVVVRVAAVASEWVMPVAD